MNDEITISLSITPTWSILKEVQDKTSAFMKAKNIGKDLTDAAIMCSSELVENAIKYGAAKPDGTNINFDLTTENDAIIIKVMNGIKSETDKDNVVEHIKKIQESSDPSKLYTERLMELMKNPKPGVSQLGLYRIAYEGEFVLDFSFEEGILTIIAERKILN